ncbi:hypothetical protein DUI87_23057 [Hirundo rustica rustica]|uniref:Uncharacterized protein n=1 Tax=Hirundo rustica rustica TaxID=333673 RepID=A0A3M0JZY6_HIRRU|nr:hypothetical protein DUI87_23057 [Hirundo rustica rustica]
MNRAKQLPERILMTALLTQRKSKTKSEVANFSDNSGRKTLSPQESNTGKEQNKDLCPQHMSETRDEVTGKKDLANEQQNILCEKFDGNWLDYREAKWGNWLEKKPWPLKPAEVLLQGCTALWGISHSSQLCAIRELAEEASPRLSKNSTIYGKEFWAQHCTSEDNTSDGLHLDPVPRIITLWNQLFTSS